MHLQPPPAALHQSLHPAGVDAQTGLEDRVLVPHPPSKTLVTSVRRVESELVSRRRRGAVVWLFLEDRKQGSQRQQRVKAVWKEHSARSCPPTLEQTGPTAVPGFSWSAVPYPGRGGQAQGPSLERRRRLHTHQTRPMVSGEEDNRVSATFSTPAPPLSRLGNWEWILLDMKQQDL